MIDVAEFTAIFRVGRSTIYQEIAAGRLRIRKIGRKTLIDINDAEAWAANFPPREQLLAPWLPAGGLAMLHPRACPQSYRGASRDGKGRVPCSKP